MRSTDEKRLVSMECTWSKDKEVLIRLVSSYVFRFMLFETILTAGSVAIGALRAAEAAAIKVRLTGLNLQRTCGSLTVLNSSYRSKVTCLDTWQIIPVNVSFISTSASSRRAQGNGQNCSLIEVRVIQVTL